MLKVTKNVYTFCFLCIPLCAHAQDALRQQSYLQRAREAWWRAATASTRDSIRQEVSLSIQSLHVAADRGQEQMDLWDICCDLWDVFPVTNAPTRTAPLLNMICEEALASAQLCDTDSLYNSRRDSLWFSSSRWPGYGGLDVYWSKYHYYPLQQVWKWWDATNAGLGINTPADEVVTAITGRGIQFVRIVDGKPECFEAVPRHLVQTITITQTQAAQPPIVLSVFDCQHHLCASFGFDDVTVAHLPPQGATLVFRCCSKGQPRTFNRCSVTQATLHLIDTDLRIHSCERAKGTIVQESSPRTFSISVFETDTSATQALSIIMEECQSTARRITILQSPRHLSQEFANLASALNQRGIAVNLISSSHPRSSIIVEQ